VPYEFNDRRAWVAVRSVLIVSLAACSAGTAGEPVAEPSPAIVPAAATIGAGTTTQLATANLADTSPVWTSSDSSVARVDQSGLVRAVRVGTVTISARSHGMPARAATAALRVDGSNPCLCGRPAGISLSQVNDGRSGAAFALDATHDSISVVAMVTEWRLGSFLELEITGVKETCCVDPYRRTSSKALSRSAGTPALESADGSCFPTGAIASPHGS